MAKEEGTYLAGPFPTREERLDAIEDKLDRERFRRQLACSVAMGYMPTWKEKDDPKRLRRFAEDVWAMVDAIINTDPQKGE